MTLRDQVRAGKSVRGDFPLSSQKTALLIIDIQKYLSQPSSPDDAEKNVYFYQESLPPVVKNIQKLAQAFRVIRDDPDFPPMTGCEVIFTYLQSATRDGRDISLDYKLSGPRLANIPRVDTPFDDLFMDECRPDVTSSGKGDILTPKTSCSVFQSTNLDYLLRNLSIEQLVIVGQLTDECVLSAVRDAADLGYLVTICEDACAATDSDNHIKGLQGMKGFARILQTAHVMDEILEDLASGLFKGGQRVVVKDAPLTDEKVLQYLREKGMEDAAIELEKRFTETKDATELDNEVVETEARKDDDEPDEETRNE